MTSSDTINSAAQVISVDTTGQNLLKCIRPDNVHCIIPKPEAKIKGLGIPALHEYAVQFLFGRIIYIIPSRVPFYNRVHFFTTVFKYRIITSFVSASCTYFKF